MSAFIPRSSLEQPSDAIIICRCQNGHDQKFDKKDVFQIMKQEHLTFLLGVPTIFQYMMEDPAFETADFLRSDVSAVAQRLLLWRL